MLIAIFAALFLLTKDLDTPHQRGTVDEFGRGVHAIDRPVTFGSACAHVNCDGQSDPLLLRVRRVSDDEVVIESEGKQ